MTRSALATRVAILLAGFAVTSLAAPRAHAQDNTLVISSFGGTYQDAQRKTLFEPFEKATGIKIVEASGIGLPKIEAMVQTKNPEVDIVDTAPEDFLVLENKGYLEKIDYSVFPQGLLKEMIPQAIKPYGTGIIFYSQVMAYNTKTYSAAHHPRSWAEFWDTKKFPGPRVLASGVYVVPPIEPALLADGLSIGALYPLSDEKIERAYKKLAEIRPNVVKWSDAAPVALQAVVTGEAVLGQVSQGRVAKLIAQGAPVGYEWNQHLLQLDFWTVPKGAKHIKNAMKFIAFASEAKPQADLVSQLPFGPSNRNALALVPEALRAELPSTPAHLKEAVMVDAEAWAKKDPAGISYVEKNLQMWNAFIAH
jgi:putative spermidine/putrescine transport system substrate-binding protein